MTEIEQKLVERIDRLEREVSLLRASVSSGKKSSGVRVFVDEIAKRFGVSSRTVRRFQFEFAGLYAIKKQTDTGKIYFERRDYEKWCAGKEAKKARGLVRRTKKESL